MQSALAGTMAREDYLRDRIALVKVLLNDLGIEAHHRGFEIGPGEGIVARAVSRHCASLTCLDVSGSFLARTAEICADSPNVTVVHFGDQLLGALTSSTFDLGYAANVFVHLDTYQSYDYLHGVHDTLRPRGRFWFNACSLGPHTADLFRTFAASYGSDPDRRPGHLRWNDVSSLAFLVREAAWYPQGRDCSTTAEVGS